MTARARVSIRALAKTFGQGPREVAAVSPVSFDVHDQEFVAIVGPSGCGKSTILNMIGGLLAPSAGEIRVDGQRMFGAPPPQVGYVFQKDTVFPWRTVERNIALGLEYRGVPPPSEPRGCARRSRWSASRASRMRSRPPLRRHAPARRAHRALVVDPEILLMDEPFGALDTHTKLELHAELLAIWEARRQTVIFVTHDLVEAITLADRIMVMTRRPGRVKLIYDVKLPRPRDVIRLRATDEYAREYAEIWNALGEEFRESRS